MKRARGLTIIELMIVIALIAIVLTVAIPSFRDILERRRLEGVANELAIDLQYARTEAVSRQANVVLQTAADGLSYTITGIPLAKTVQLPTGVTVTANVTRTYEGFRGTAGGDATIDIASTNTAGQLRITSNFMGRVQMCSPSGSLKGYATC